MNVVWELKKYLSPARYVLALSGGADSVALALACEKLQQENSDYEFVAVHVEHGLRGEEGVRDKQFVEDFCQQHNLECIVKSVDVPGRVKLSGQSVEEAARDLRYRALMDVALQKAAKKILTAHHANDQAETVILRLVRGAGTRGLGAMQRDNGFVVRPLLDFSKEELVKYCEDHQAKWVEDSTNKDLEYRRNYVRQEIMPLLTKLNANVVYTLCQTANALQEDDNYLSTLAERLGQKIIVEDELVTTDWHLYPLPVRKRVLFRWLGKLGLQPTSQHIESLEKLITTGTTGKELALPGLTLKYAYRKVYALRDILHIRR